MDKREKREKLSKKESEISTMNELTIIIIIIFVVVEKWNGNRGIMRKEKGQGREEMKIKKNELNM